MGMFDWCRPMSAPKYLIMKILRLIAIFLAIVFNITLLMFETLFFIQTLSSNTDVTNLAVQFTAFVWLLMGFTTYLTLLLRHKKLMAFFQDFKNCLTPLNNLSFIRNNKEKLKVGSKKYVALTYSLHIGVFLIMLIMSSSNVVRLLNKTSAENVKDFISILTYIIENLLPNMFYVWASFFTGLADIIPIFIYYNAAMVLELLNQQWKLLIIFILQRGKGRNNQQMTKNLKATSMLEQEIRGISRLYNSIVRLVCRADYLFGNFVIFSQLFSIFVICSVTPVVLKGFRNPFYQIFPHVLVVFILRLVWPIFLASKLYTSAARLRASVLSFQARADLNHFSASEEKSVNYLLTQLQDDKLAANPMGLYSITPSLFSTIFNTIATYFIILLQAAGQPS